MLIVDSPWLPGNQPAVLAATLLFNKLYLPYILPYVRISNPRSDQRGFYQVIPSNFPIVLLKL